MGVRPDLEQLHSFPEGRPSTRSAHFWGKESGGVRSTQHPGPTWVKEESPWGSSLMEGRCPTPKESPCPQGPRVGGKGAPLHTLTAAWPHKGQTWPSSTLPG